MVGLSDRMDKEVLKRQEQDKTKRQDGYGRAFESQ
jgi:hypothetical protein